MIYLTRSSSLAKEGPTVMCRSSHIRIRDSLHLLRARRLIKARLIIRPIITPIRGEHGLMTKLRLLRRTSLLKCWLATSPKVWTLSPQTRTTDSISTHNSSCSETGQQVQRAPIKVCPKFPFPATSLPMCETNLKIYPSKDRSTQLLSFKV